MDAAAATAAQQAYGALSGSITGLLDVVDAELSAFAGDPRRATDACVALIRACDTHVTAASNIYDHLGRLLGTSRNRDAAAAVFECLQARGLTAGAAPVLYDALLQVKELPLRLRAVTALALAVEQGLRPDARLLERLASALVGADTDPPGLAAILNVVAGSAGVPQLLRRDQSPWVRGLAARVLDAEDLPDAHRYALALGAGAAARLSYYLAFTRATHADLVRLTKDGSVPLRLLASLDDAERLLGAERLARVIAGLGWSRAVYGIDARPLVSVSIGGSFPVLVSPAEADLLEEAGGAERCAAGVMLIAHGFVEDAAASPQSAAHESRIRRFRDYNVAHAEVLNEILEIAPLTAGRARRISAHVERLADDFAWLFAQHDDEAGRAPATARSLAHGLAMILPGDDAAVLETRATRLVQAFEDPSSLDEVTTVHGLKRYLHQRGLRNAFRLFQSGAAANRCADLVHIADSGAVHVIRRIRYIEFEPSSSGELPPIVSMVVDACMRWVAHGTLRLPDVRLLIYAHEVQLYLSYRAHPAFVRIDLSPPRRGGMIDLEYFAVSQNDLSHHPARDVPAVQEFLRRMGFHVTLEGHRIHARYDKERAFDRADILDRTAALLRLAPLLMDLDWTLGSLAYPRDARMLVQASWADFFEREGVLPLDQLLTGDRCRVRVGGVAERDVEWDGTGSVPELYQPVDAHAWWPRLQRVLDSRGLGIRVAGVGAAAPGQRELERRLLAPLRAARAGGALAATEDRLLPAGPAQYRSEHEAVRLAALLAAGGPPLQDGARLAAVIRDTGALFRFRTTGAVQGCRVERADLALSMGAVAIFVLHDASGSPQLACSVAGGCPAEVRDGATGEWRWHGDLETAVLLEQLLRDNYLAPQSLRALQSLPDTAALQELYTRPALRPPRVALPGDRALHAEAAAPGRAAGVVRLGTRRAAQELNGAILAAPVVRPEDGPLLRRSAGVVTTGGGILSHAALLALEMRKPSLLLRGTWHGQGGASQSLRLVRSEYCERRVRIGDYDVVCWELVREHEEHVREGDLVAIDADEGTLRLLGQDRVALALHHGLLDLEAVAEQLAGAQNEATVLELRGAMLRIMHGLRRLLQQLDAPSLAHHAARQLLSLQSEATAPSASSSRRELLQILLANPLVGSAAAAAATAAGSEMMGRLKALAEQARWTIPTLVRPLEVVFLRHAVLRLAMALRALHEVHGSTAGDVEIDEIADAVDDLAARRLREVHALLSGELQRYSTEPHDCWRTQHLLPQVSVIGRVLGRRLDPEPGAWPDAPSLALPSAAGLDDRLILSAADGGLELAPLIGGKAASLAEMERILGADAVPSWFAVTDRAFRLMLEVPVAPVAGPVTGHADGASPALGAAVAAVLCRADLSPSGKAAAIAALWDAAEVPTELRTAVEGAYARMIAETARERHGPDGSPRNAEPPVPEAADAAVRSSGWEEDRPDATWAGQFVTFLNIRGADAVLDHLKRAWAGLWTEGALLSRGSSTVPPGGGLIVQRMVAARVSGVLHTASVATAELRVMVANVGLGLGAGVVSGEVGVDEVRMVKGAMDSAAIDVRYEIGDKAEQVVPDPSRGGTITVPTVYHQRFRAALEYSEVLELARLGTRLETVMGQPLDIEFAFEGPALRVLQARPIPLFHHALTETLRRYPFKTRP
jgi:hypothetical protein